VHLAARKGFTKAAVATARKLAMILHRIWRNGIESIRQRRQLPNHKSSRPRKQGRVKRPPGRRQIDLEKTVEALMLRQATR
jgi:hypothetical protein